MNVLRHGTLSGYKHRCRCEQCSAVNAAYCRTYYRRKRQLRKVDAGAAREHLANLRQMGLGAPAVADCSGCMTKTIWKIATGRQQRIYPATEQKILAVTAEGIADGALVDATLTRELLLELLEEGWTRRELSAALGLAAPGLPMLYSGKVQARTQMRVERLHQRAMQHGMLGIARVTA